MTSSCGKWAQVILLILAYWTCSIGLTFYNRHLFHNFDIPIAATTCHFFITFALAGFSRKGRQCVTGHSSVLLDWKTFRNKIIPTGLISALDIGLSNWSLVFITVPLYTMVKSTSILFILFFALILKLEKLRWSLVIVTLLISTGLFIFVFKMTEFNFFGFVLCLCAAATGGLRWTLSQLLTQKKELGLGNPMDFLFHLQPVMVFGMMPLLLSHGLLPFLSTRKLFGGDVAIFEVNLVKILCGGGLAFALGMTEYFLLAKTSSLTFALSGIIKELVTMTVAQFDTKEDQKLTSLNWIGFGICVSGIACHSIFKLRDQRINREVKVDDEGKVESTPLIEKDGEGSEEETIYDAKL